MKTHVSGILIALLLLNFCQTVQARTVFRDLDAQVNENKTAILALAIYPEEFHTPVLELSSHPELLVKLASLQELSSARFKDLLTAYPDSEQKQVMELLRYPDLITDLVKTRAQTRNQINLILGQYPKEIHQNALLFGETRFDLLVQLHDLNEGWKRDFDSLISDYSPTIQSSLYKLVEVPEILALLKDNLHLAILLGEAYKQNSQATLQKMLAWNIEAAEVNIQARQEWAQSIEEDPEAALELQNSARTFAEENGYNLESRPNEEVSSSTIVHVHRYYRPYPYWVGCPWWYPYRYWRPVPAWYHWGYYYNPGGSLVITGFPSLFFSLTLFGHHPIHHFPRLHYHLGNHLVHHHLAHHPHSHQHLHKHFPYVADRSLRRQKAVRALGDARVSRFRAASLTAKQRNTALSRLRDQQQTRVKDQLKRNNLPGIRNRQQLRLKNQVQNRRLRTFQQSRNRSTRPSGVRPSPRARAFHNQRMHRARTFGSHARQRHHMQRSFRAKAFSSSRKGPGR